jgi:HK97 family phage portal protein
MTITAWGKEGWTPMSSIFQSAGEIFGTATNPELVNLYIKSELVLACVRELENATAQATLQLGHHSNGKWETVEDATIDRLFYDNPNMGYDDIIKLTVARLSLTGASFAVMDAYTNQSGAASLFPVPTQCIKPIARGIELLGFELQTDDGPRKLESKNVAGVIYRDPSRIYGYLSPLQSAHRQIQIDEERINLTVEVMRNRNMPGQIFETESALSSDQRDQLKESLAQATGRETESRGSALLLPKGVKHTESVKIDDIDFSVLNAMTESRICMIFQVPPILIGAQIGLERATYSNYAQARDSFYMETVAALWDRISSSWTRDILRAQGEKELEFRFDCSSIKAFQEDKTAQATMASALYAAGLIDRAEGRTMVGFETVVLEDADATAEEAPAFEAEKLDGAQVTAAKDIIMAVATGQLPRDAGLGMLEVMFNLTPEQATKMMGNVGDGFVPTPAAEPTEGGLAGKAAHEPFLRLPA